MRTQVRALGLGLIGISAVLAAGCRPLRHHRPLHPPRPVVVTPPPPAPPGPVVDPPPSQVIVVEKAPPPPRKEVIGKPPVPGHVWCGGHWVWRGGRYVWEPGRWMAPPRRGALWVAPRWEKGPRGWHHVPGHWR